MSNDSDRKGFGGLAEMISEEEHPSKADIDPGYKLISLGDFPSMPAPWSSQDAGEGWRWGDYYIIIQKKPETVFDVMSKMTNKPDRFEGMVYPYAATVFRDPTTNSYGPSSRPVMVISIEQSDFGALAKKMGINLADLEDDASDLGSGALMLGVFTGDVRFNLGSYEGALDLNSARQTFFSHIQSSYKLAGQPERLGTIEAVREKVVTRKLTLPSNKQPSGCAPVVVGFGITGLLLANYFFN